MTMNVDFLGLTTKSQYKANDYWSTSEAKMVSQNFLKTAANQAKTPPTMAAMWFESLGVVGFGGSTVG